MKKAQLVLSSLVFSFTLLFASLVAANPQMNPARSQSLTRNENFRVIVNSNRDGAKSPDAYLTLREAIEIVNGTLPLDKRTQGQLPITKPLVAITPTPQTEIFRGLTVVANGVTIRGLSLYGFTAQPRTTVSTPPADIFIADEVTAAQTSQKQFLPQAQSLVAPKNVVIENNWLGISPNSTNNGVRSAFGVSVFNSLGTTIQHNRITHHDGSGISTGKQAANLRIIQNVLECNGFARMPDAIRLEGIIINSEIVSNFILDNAGSAVYVFKPEGSVLIQKNFIYKNGQQLQRAAIYLMGNDHAVLKNSIRQQSGDE